MMSESKGKGSLTGQIVVAVLITLLVGSTAPWWWKVLFPEKEKQESQQTSEPKQQDSPESLSRTKFSLPGDAVRQFRVADIQGREMAIEIDYGFNAQHGKKVMAGARLRGIASGYMPTFVPTFPEGTVVLQMSVSEPGSTTDIEIFLYEWGRPAEPFAQRTFPYRMRFE